MEWSVTISYDNLTTNPFVGTFAQCIRYLQRLDTRSGAITEILIEPTSGKPT